MPNSQVSFESYPNYSYCLSNEIKWEALRWVGFLFYHQGEVPRPLDIVVHLHKHTNKHCHSFSSRKSFNGSCVALEADFHLM